MALALLSPLVASSEPPKPQQRRVGVLPLQEAGAVPDGIAALVTETVAAALRERRGLEVLASRDVADLLSHERQRALLGCASGDCVTADLGELLDVDWLVTGSLARDDTGWLLHLKLLDVRAGAVLEHLQRRTVGADLRDLLDAIPPATASLLPPEAGTTEALPVPVADVPDEALDPTPLTFLRDPSGNLLAVTPFSGTEGPVYWGMRQAAGSTGVVRLWRQRLFGASSSGDSAYGLNFWEPRARVPAEASFDFKDGSHVLTCGEHRIEFTPLAKSEVANLLKAARFYGPRWQRTAHALARDDAGRYYYVDRPLKGSSYHLYVGERAHMKGAVPEVLVDEQGAQLLSVPSGRLFLERGEGPGVARWIAADARTELTRLDLWGQRAFIYGPRGPYAGAALGTPCDPYLRGKQP